MNLIRFHPGVLLANPGKTILLYSEITCEWRLGPNQSPEFMATHYMILPDNPPLTTDHDMW